MIIHMPDEKELHDLLDNTVDERGRLIVWSRKDSADIVDGIISLLKKHKAEVNVKGIAEKWTDLHKNGMFGTKVKFDVHSAIFNAINEALSWEE